MFCIEFSAGVLNIFNYSKSHCICSCVFLCVWFHYVFLGNVFMNLTICSCSLGSWFCHGMERLSALLALCEEILPVTGGFPHKRQQYYALVSFLLAWRSCWTNCWVAGNLKTMMLMLSHCIVLNWHWGNIWQIAFTPNIQGILLGEIHITNVLSEYKQFSL